MASLLLVVCCLVLHLSWIRAQNCPVVDSIFPPSGTLGVSFLVRGSNLDNLREIATDILVDSSSIPRTIPLGQTQGANETQLRFTISGTTLFNDGLRNVTFVPTQQSCTSQSFQLDFRERKCWINVYSLCYLYNVISFIIVVCKTRLVSGTFCWCLIIVHTHTRKHCW